MAKSGLTPKFSSDQMTKDVLKWLRNDEKKFIEALSFIGEQALNKSRANGEFTDRTGALRSSEGYSIVKDGKVLSTLIDSDNADGKKGFNDTLDEIRGKYNKGYVLFLIAGMEYALYVEANGYDVISGSIPSKSSMHADLKELLG